MWNLTKNNWNFVTLFTIKLSALDEADTIFKCELISSHRKGVRKTLTWKPVGVIPSTLSRAIRISRRWPQHLWARVTNGGCIIKAPRPGPRVGTDYDIRDFGFQLMWWMLEIEISHIRVRWIKQDRARTVLVSDAKINVKEIKILYLLKKGQLRVI